MIEKQRDKYVFYPLYDSSNNYSPDIREAPSDKMYGRGSIYFWTKRQKSPK
jgi:hypothetical protein